MLTKYKTSRRVMIKALALAVFLALSGYRSIAVKLLDLPVDIINFPDVIGNWKLVNINGGDPGAGNIKSCILILNSNGTLSYTLEMKGDVEGAPIESTGNWSLADKAIVFTIGSRKGKSQINLENNVLTINPDFIISSKSQIIKTQYIKF